MKGDDAHERIQKLLVTGDNRLKQGVAHLCIEDPRGRVANEREGGWAELFATHPPIAKRIALLREMGYQRGRT